MPYDPKYLPAKVMLSANENPASIPPAVMGNVVVELSQVPMNRYPDPLANALRDDIAAAYGLARENVLVGNGGDELLFDIAFAWGGPGRKTLDLPPTFSVYAANARLCGTEVVDIARGEDFSVDEAAVLDRVAQADIDYLAVCSPNNPTGNTVSRDFVEALLNATDALVLVDEAYGEFGGESVLPLLAEHKNLAILHTFSKAYSMAAVRVGYLLASPEVITELQKVRQPYSVDTLSQVVAREVFKFRDLFESRTQLLVSERDRMIAALQELDGVEVWPSSANFVLFRLDESVAQTAWQTFYDAGILVRDFTTGPLTSNCLRASVGLPDQNDAFLATLASILEA